MIASVRTCSTAPSSSRTVTVPADIQALFLDRDGTLIEDRHFVGAVDQVSLLPGTREALARLLAAGTRLFILSNQSGVNRGYFTLADVEAVNRRMIELLDLGPTPFTRICIEEMLAEFSLSRESSWMIGDRPSDWEAGLAARVRVAAITAASPQAEWESRRLTLGIPGYASLLEWADDQRG